MRLLGMCRFSINVKSQNRIKDSIQTLEEYLKLLETTPVILGKIRDMKAMDTLLRSFFSNFTITPATDGGFKGSTVAYKLNEPWKGFVKNKDFVPGMGKETLELPTPEDVWAIVMKKQN